ncbi:hypothetical protein [Marinomonas foliarum]|uniref:Uncharacterized protein n=1 Tax=Marinomonas foliarum TaxID=491950 RepID=A0A369AHY5_9GAMM|nr:hypothetical protein [Marinomonas foliarum]RCX07044.1 hypothetical protein DFP77_107144 [Marinomonas foliarum]
MSDISQELEAPEVANITEDQADFLKELEAEEAQADFDPEEAKAEKQAEAEQVQMDEQAALLTAMSGLGMIEFSLKRVIHKDFEFTAETKAYAIENLGPVLVKYGALLPGWLAAYDAEIKAAMAVGKLVSEGVSTAQTLKEKDQAEAKASAEEKARVRVAA